MAPTDTLTVCLWNDNTTISKISDDGSVAGAMQGNKTMRKNSDDGIVAGPMQDNKTMSKISDDGIVAGPMQDNKTMSKNSDDGIVAGAVQDNKAPPRSGPAAPPQAPQVTPPPSLLWLLLLLLPSLLAVRLPWLGCLPRGIPGGLWPRSSRRKVHPPPVPLVRGRAAACWAVVLRCWVGAGLARGSLAGPVGEGEAMRAVATDLNGGLPSWDPLGEPCDPGPHGNGTGSGWEGVTCSGGSVVAIDLPGYGLAGTHTNPLHRPSCAPCCVPCRAPAVRLPCPLPCPVCRVLGPSSAAPLRSSGRGRVPAAVATALAGPARPLLQRPHGLARPRVGRPRLPRVPQPGLRPQR